MMKQLVLIIFVVLGLIVSCEVADTETNADMHEAIMKVIAEDDALYDLQDWNNTEYEDFGLASMPDKDHHVAEIFERVVRDSNYVWKFARRDMEQEREVIIEVEDDTSAQSLILDHVTGNFHVKQFERIWTDDGRWYRGDSVQFSVKPIDLNSQRRVMFKKRFDASGAEHWIPVASTMKLEQSGDALAIESLQVVRADTIITLDEFETEFYSRRHPLALVGAELRAVVSNELPDEAEMVKSRLGFIPRMDHRGHGSRSHFLFVETLDNGDKLYVQPLANNDSPERRFKGSIEAVDLRTLFDHDYMQYSMSRVGFMYDKGRRNPPGGRP